MTDATSPTRAELLAAINAVGAANVVALRAVTDALATFGIALGENTATLGRLADLLAPGDGGRVGARFGFIDATRPHDVLDQMLADSIGVARPVGAFVRGFSGSSHPSSFQSSAVAHAEALGVGAMLNTKLPWGGLANGDYDTLIRDFWQTWPVECRGDLTVNHEPENDAPITGSQYPGNPEWLAWADANGPIWSAGIVRYISVAAPIIRARGLDVKVGGVLMDDRSRWDWFDWWGQLTGDHDVVTFGVDAYSKHRRDPLRGADLMPNIVAHVGLATEYDIGSVSIFETAVDRREYTTGDLIGTDETVATWLTAYGAALAALPAIRSVCHFHDPAGPASAYAQLNGVALAAWAGVCTAA